MNSLIQCTGKSPMSEVFCPTCQNITPIFSDHSDPIEGLPDKIRDTHHTKQLQSRIIIKKTKQAKCEDQRGVCGERGVGGGGDVQVGTCTTCCTKDTNYIQCTSFTCREHKQPVSRFCKCCRAPLCDRCQSEPHSKHEADVENLSSVMEKRKALLDKYVTDMRDCKSNKITQINTIDAIWTAQEANLKKTKSDIQRHANHLIYQIQKMASGLVNNLDRFQEQKHYFYLKHRNVLDYRVRCVERMSHLASSLSTSGEEDLLLVNYDETRMRAHRMIQACQHENDAIKALQQTYRFESKDDCTLGDLKPFELPTPQIRSETTSPSPDVEISQQCMLKELRNLLWRTEPPTDGNHHPVLSDVVFFPDGKLAVADNSKDGKKIDVYQSNGERSHVINEGGIMPFGLAMLDNGNLAVTDHWRFGVNIYQQDGTLLTKLDTFKFIGPCGIVKLPDKKLAVVDRLKTEVVILSEDGQLVHRFGSKGREVGQFLCPEYLTLDSHNRLIITDAERNAVSMYDLNGHFIHRFGSHSDQYLNLGQPAGVVVDYQDNLLVCDNSNNRLMQYDPSGRYITTALNLQDHDLEWPGGLALNSTGRLAITENSVPDVKVYHMYESIL